MKRVNMPRDYKGFLTTADNENTDQGLEKLSAQDRADAKYNMRKRAARGLRDLEIVSSELDENDHGRIAVEWFQLNTTRSPTSRISDILSMLWTGFNQKSHAGRDMDYQERKNWIERRIDEEGSDIDPEDIERGDMQPGYGPTDWENWLERAIRSSEPLAHVNVSIDTYDDDTLDELESEYRNGEGVGPDEFTALFRTGRVTVDEYNKIAESGGMLISEPEDDS